jgi:hypothetical protein
MRMVQYSVCHYMRFMVNQLWTIIYNGYITLWSANSEHKTVVHNRRNTNQWNSCTEHQRLWNWSSDFDNKPNSGPNNVGVNPQTSRNSRLLVRIHAKFHLNSSIQQTVIPLLLSRLKPSPRQSIVVIAGGRAVPSIHLPVDLPLNFTTC